MEKITNSKVEKEISQNELQEVVQNYISDEKKLLKKNGLEKRLIVVFPKHKVVPLTGRVSLWILKLSGALLDTQYMLTKK